MKDDHLVFSDYIRKACIIIRDVFILLSVYSAVFAEVIIDGSLAGRAALTGPDYQITADMGRQSGGNLFHSFSVFDIASEESAIFTNEGAIQPIDNIIGRITSSSHSNIDGLIRSDIPGANLFLFNPNGFIFGPNAELDTRGSFHVSTADYIRFEEDTIFYSVFENDEILSIDKPLAFGFLDHKQPVGIVFNGRLVNTHDFSITSGHITVSENSHLAALSGTLNIASVASAGEVKLENGGITTEGFAQMGQIDLSSPAESAEIERSRFRSSLSGQQVVIRGGDLILEDSLITVTGSEDSTQSLVNDDAIDIQLTDKLSLQGNLTQIRLPDGSKNVSILAGDVQMQDGSIISIQNTNSSQASRLSIISQNITIDGKVSTLNNAQNPIIQTEGNSEISINTESLQIINGGSIQTTGSNVSIAADQIVLNGVRRGLRSEIVATTPIEGTIGNIIIKSTDVKVLNGARIEATAGLNASTPAGALTINAHHILVNGRGGGENDDQFSSSIQSEDQRLSVNEDKPTTLELHAHSLHIKEGANVSTRTIGPGNGAELAIDVNELRLQNQGIISASSESESRPGSDPGNTGNAGNITITTNFLSLENQSQITTSAVADGKGAGGNINISPHLNIPNLLILQNASNIIANVEKGEGNAGDINIKINEGGALFQTSDSLIQASSISGLGIDGNIEINAPDTDITSRFKPLPSRIIDASTILQKPCAQRFYSDTISFVSQHYEVLPDSPYALRTALPNTPLSTESYQLPSASAETSAITPNRSVDILCRQSIQ